MSLVRLLGFTTLSCGCVSGRYHELSTNREIDTVKELIRKGRVGYATKELKDVNQQLEQVSY